jgi:hypothetical protein
MTMNRKNPTVTRTILVLAAALIAGAALAQHQHQPYAGHQGRSIKALSEQQIADLKAGRGMGLALPAELNGYPGPLHVLELADRLALSAEQRSRMQALFDAMKAETIPIGERLIEEEARLDGLFASRHITEASLAEATAAIGATQARLRAAHLRYHLAAAVDLTPHQIRLYAELRGYHAGTQGHPAPGHPTPGHPAPSHPRHP